MGMSRKWASRMTLPRLTLTLLGGVCVGAPAHSADTTADARADGNAPTKLQPFQAGYLWYWHGAPIAYSQVNLQHQADDRWLYSSTTRPRGIGRLYPMRPDLQSLMRITPDQVLPQHFKVTGSGRGHDSDVTFNWQTLRATGLYEGVPIDEPITPGTQDDLSVQIAMLTKLLAGEMPDRLMEIVKDGVREYDYVREGEEQLSTALGPVEAVIYASHHPGSPRTTRFWCAPSLGYIPLQVQQWIERHGQSAVEWTMKIRSLSHAP